MRARQTGLGVHDMPWVHMTRESCRDKEFSVVTDFDIMFLGRNRSALPRTTGIRARLGGVHDRGTSTREAFCRDKLVQ